MSHSFHPNLVVARAACNALAEQLAYGQSATECVAVLGSILRGSDLEAYELALFIASHSSRRHKTAPRRKVLAAWLLDPETDKEPLRQEPNWWNDCLSALEEIEAEGGDINVRPGYRALGELLLDADVTSDDTLDFFASKMDPSDAEGMAQYSTLLSLLGRSGDALKVLANLNDRTHVFYFALATAYECAGDYRRAISSYEQCTKDETLLLALGRIHEKRGDLHSALGYCNRALQLNPTSRRLQIRVAVAKAFVTQDASDLTHARALLDEVDIKRTSLESADAAFDLARITALEKEWSKSLACIDACLETRVLLLHQFHPSVCAARNEKALVYRGMGELDKAMEIWHQLRVIYEKRNDVVNLAATIFNLADTMEAQGDLPGAIEKFRECAQLEEKKLPDHWTRSHLATLNRLGEALTQQKDIVGAKAAYQRCLSLCEAAKADESAAQLRVIIHSLN